MKDVLILIVWKIRSCASLEEVSVKQNVIVFIVCIDGVLSSLTIYNLNQKLLL